MLIPLGKLLLLGLAKAQINCVGQLRVQHLSVSFHPLLTLSLHLCFGPGGKSLTSGECFRGVLPRIKPGFPVKISPFCPEVCIGTAFC